MIRSVQYTEGINHENISTAANTTEILRPILLTSSANFSDYVHVPRRNLEDILDPTENPDLFEGDIKLDHFTGRNAIRNEARKWPQARVPFEVAFPYGLLGRVYAFIAMSQIQLNTCVRFVPRDDETDYVRLTRGRGCSSYVGRVGGAQEIVLQEGGCDQVGIIIHELMHALGFWHEQSRFDRDAHVLIHWDNIRPGMWFNFGKGTPINQQTLNEEYDFESILHYGPKAFAIDKKRPTISALNPNAASRRMGQRSRMTPTDVRKINKLYKCGNQENYVVDESILKPLKK